MTGRSHPTLGLAAVGLAGAAWVTACAMPQLAPSYSADSTNSPDVGGEDAGPDAAPPSVSDACLGKAPGIYCAQTLKISASARYSCSGNNALLLDLCTEGCGESSPAGNAACFSPVCPADGDFCGGSIGGNASSLYVCSGGVVAAESPCPFQCESGPSQGADYCQNGSTPPSNIQAAALSGGAVVQWTAQENPTTGFTVIAAPGGNVATVGPNIRQATIPNLTNGITYSFEIQADDGAPSVASNLIVPDVGSNIMPEIPHRHQVHKETCESASLSMILAHESISASEDDVISLLPVQSEAGTYSAGILHWGNPFEAFVGEIDGSESNYTGYGTYYPTIQGAALKLNATVISAGVAIAPATLYQNLLAGHPAVVWVNGSLNGQLQAVAPWDTWDGQQLVWYGPNEHAIALVGITPDAVIAQNPDVNSAWQAIARPEFEQSFLSFNQMAVIIQ
jgi:uncharacterized protein YvpB